MTTGVKGCGENGKEKKEGSFKAIFIGITTFLTVIGLTICITFLILRPTKPTFTLHNAAIMNLNLDEKLPTLLTTTLQVMLFSRNPNHRVGIFYDELNVYAVYKDQQITMPTVKPASDYQGTRDMTVWSPYLYGVKIPIDPHLAAELGSEEMSGFLNLRVKIDGKLRWKVGRWRSGHYHINVDCPALFRYYYAKPPQGRSGRISPEIRFQQISKCHVDV